MFDNPNEELKRLEEQLLQAEMTDKEFDRFFSDFYDDFEPAAQESAVEEAYEESSDEMDDLLTGAAVTGNVRNYANGYGYDDPMPEFHEPVAAPRQRPAQQRPVQQRSEQPRTAPQNAERTTDDSRYAAPARKPKGVKGLVITACIECAGIVGVVLWWMLRIL